MKMTTRGARSFIEPSIFFECRLRSGGTVRLKRLLPVAEILSEARGVKESHVRQICESR